MMCSLIFVLQGNICAVSLENTATIERRVQNHVDFVKGQPTLNSSFVATKQNLGILQVKINEPSIRPPAVFR